MTYDVAIIGGGIVGCAIARELSRYRLSLVLVESECEVGFGTSKSNSGIIHAGHHSPGDTLKGQLEWEGNQTWDRLHEELDFGFERIGELMVAWDDEQVEILEQYRARGEARGVPGLEMWDSDRVRREEPNVNRSVRAALHAPTAGVVNPYEVCFSLIDCARHNGLDVRTDTAVIDIGTAEDGLRLETTAGALDTRFAINAAGMHADRIAAMAGVGDFTISARKGEEYLLDKRLKGLVKRIIFPCPTPTSKGVLVIPTFDGTIMVGPTANPVEARDDLTTSEGGGAQIFDQVQRTVPGISARDCIAEFAGLRAVADGEDFIIGPTARKGFINVAGIQSPGLTAAPAIAEMVARILEDEGLTLAPDEGFVAAVPKHIIFNDLDTDAQISLAADDAHYGRICCRCELVTEGEVLAAIRAGAGTLDGIKFRTRAGMGRCQGGFCTWRCMELISQELGVPLTDVTKRGGGSWVLCEREDIDSGAD